MLWPHEGVGIDAVTVESLQLPIPCSHHPLSDGLGGLGCLGGSKVFVADRGHLDMEVDPVQDGSRDPVPVALNPVASAGASPQRIRCEPARTGVHCRDEHEPGGIGEGHGGAGYGYAALFHGLPEQVDDVSAEFGEFVEEEHAVVGQAHLAGPRYVASAYEPGVGDGVVRRPEGAVQDEGGMVEQARHAEDLRCLEGFFEAEGRQNSRNSLCEHGLSGAWRAHQQNVIGYFLPCVMRFQHFLHLLDRKDQPGWAQRQTVHKAANGTDLYKNCV